jgi:hypothetical protein
MLHKLKPIHALVAPLAIAPLLACPQPAQALLTYYVYESGGNVIIETGGTLQLPNPVTPEGCAFAFIGNEAVMCTGPVAIVPGYKISGPTAFGSGGSALATSRGGITAWLWGQTSTFYIDASYLPGTPIVSSATIASQTLASVGFTTPGPLGTWTLLPAGGLDPYTADDTIRVVIGQAPPPTVPGPLPLLGVGAAFGFSRRLRCRRSHGCMDLRQRTQSQD